MPSGSLIEFVLFTSFEVFDLVHKASCEAFHYSLSIRGNMQISAPPSLKDDSSFLDLRVTVPLWILMTDDFNASYFNYLINADSFLFCFVENSMSEMTWFMYCCLFGIALVLWAINLKRSLLAKLTHQNSTYFIFMECIN